MKSYEFLFEDEQLLILQIDELVLFFEYFPLPTPHSRPPKM